jgi:beta-xylosidase
MNMPANNPPVNPIIPGFAPDPSCIRVDDTYYLVNSAFQYFPNLPIYTSTDLVNWTHTTNAINRRSQLSFADSFTRIAPPDQWGESMLASGGLYAPTIRYHDGLFYVVCTNVIQRFGEDWSSDQRQNFIVTSRDPFGDEWSDPIFFDFEGIDVSPFWDEDTGKSYIVGSAVPGPMTTIKLFEIDLATGKKLSDEKLIWRGTGGVYPEGPHIWLKDGWYYLVISEGGCFPDHMITAARSRELWGPYEAYEHNPLVTAKDTNEYIQHIGHSDMFTDPEGNWWAVCLGVRKDEKGRYIMGRETFLTPMTWPENSWPQVSQPRMTVERSLPAKKTTITAQKPETEYIYLRDADLSAHRIKANTISLQPTSADITDGHRNAQPTFIAKRIRRVDSGVASVTLHRSSPLPSQSSSTAIINAGIALYKDEHRFARLYISRTSTSSAAEIVFELRNAGKSISRDARISILSGEEEAAKKVQFRITYSEETIELHYNIGEDWKGLGGTVDSLELTGLDFTGPVVGLFACTVGDRDDGSAESAEQRPEVVFEDFSVQ